MKKPNFYLSLKRNLTRLFVLNMVINLTAGINISAAKNEPGGYTISCPEGTDLCDPIPFPIEIVVTPAGATNYDFYGNSVNGFVLIQSGPSNTWQSDDAPHSFYCVVTDASGTQTTNVLDMKILNPWFMYLHHNVTTNPVCAGAQFSVFPAIWNSYQWYRNGVAIPGATSSTYYGTQTGTYNYMASNNCGTDSSLYGVYMSVNPLPSATITPAGPTTFCSGGSVVLNAPTGANKTYRWKKGANLISGATLSSYTATTGGNYKVIVTNTVTGCSKTTASATVVTVNALPAATITPQGPTTFCAGGSVVLAANTGAGLTYKWKKGSNFISGATLANYTATTGGNYKVQVTNSNGCSKISGNVAVSVPCKEGESENPDNHRERKWESEMNVSVFPNPNSGEFTIKFSTKPTSPIQIELTDELGKVVKRFETNDETVVIKESNLVKGIYCLTARNKDEVAIKKINIIK